jgi:hypothetical protein
MSTVPTVTAQDLELEHGELLPARETLMVPRPLPRLFPWGPLHPNPGGPFRTWGATGSPVYARGE